MITNATQKNDQGLFRLELSSNKICKFRKYDVKLMVKKMWRLTNKVSEIAILKALLSAKCCRFDTFYGKNILNTHIYEEKRSNY